MTPCQCQNICQSVQGCVLLPTPTNPPACGRCVALQALVNEYGERVLLLEAALAMYRQREGLT
jgi:hypothetical protein